MTGSALVLGIGNPLRGDDGVGWVAADILVHDRRMRGTRVVAVPQLMPELALDVHDASVVVVIDAAAPGGRPGAVTVEHVATTDPHHPHVRHSHAFDPAALRALAIEVYGTAAPMVTVTVTPSRLDYGEGLSPQVAAAVPGIVDATAGIIGARSGHA